IDGRVRKETHHRLALRLTSLFHRRAFDGSREVDADVLVRGALRAFRRQRADVPSEQRQRLLHFERADHEKREIRCVRKTIAIQRHHLRAIELGNPMNGEALAILPASIFCRSSAFTPAAPESPIYAAASDAS